MLSVALALQYQLQFKAKIAGHYSGLQKPVKRKSFLSKLRILFNICLLKIMIFRAKYLSETTILQQSEQLYPALI